MKNHFFSKHPSQIILVAIALLSIGLLAVALYLQWVLSMQPCPLCILQRYAFFVLALICLISGFTHRFHLGAALGVLTALTGSGIALYHIWIQAHPGVSCGIDPLETVLNKIPPAQWIPALFQADGLCSAGYPPILWLSIPQWSLVWFLGFSLSLIWVWSRRT